MKVQVLFRKAKKPLAVCLFLAVALFFFTHITYLFRSAGLSGRAVLSSFRSEEPETIDVVYIGASNVYCYFNTMLAWGGDGVPSYCYANPNLNVSTMKGGIKDICKRQSPSLVICDVRKFLSSFWDFGLTGSLRDVVDAYDLGLDRLEMICYAKKINQIPDDEIAPLIFDLAYYHPNYRVLGFHENWLLIDNKASADYTLQWDIFKGYRPNYVNNVTAYFREYRIIPTEERQPLLPQSEQCLRDLIEYCREQDIELLLTETPYVVLEPNDLKETNTVMDIAREYSVPFLNFNTQEMYETLGLDFESDLFDRYHLNVLGAEKFTGYLMDYITGEYALKDRRSSQAYASWQDLYTNQYEPFMEDYRDQTSQQAESIRRTTQKEERIRDAKDMVTWLSLVNDPNLTCLFSSCNAEKNDTLQIACSVFGIDPELGANSVGTSAGGVATAYNDAHEYANSIGMPVGIPPIRYSIAADGENMRISVGQKEYLNGGAGGIFIVVVNHNTAEVVDCVILQTDGAEAGITHVPVEG